MTEPYEKLKKLVSPHIDSYNWFVNHGLHHVLKTLKPVYYRFVNPSNVALKLWVENLEVVKPRDNNTPLLPHMCRQGHITYGAESTLSVGYLYFDVVTGEEFERGIMTKNAGRLPVMIGSTLCNLHGMSQEELIQHKEEEFELGGYFVCNGLEKVARLLIMNRINYMMCQAKPRFRQTGPLFSQYACHIRCKLPDECVVTNVMHYLLNGEIKIRLTVNRNIIIIGLVTLLRALSNATDRVIFEKFVQGNHKDNFMVSCVTAMLKSAKNDHIITQTNAREYLGTYLKVILAQPAQHANPEEITSTEITKIFLDDYILIHCKTNEEKFEMLIQMARKLYGFVNGLYEEDNVDCASHQEVLSVGSVFAPLLKRQLTIQLLKIRKQLTVKKVLKYESNSGLEKFFNPVGLFQIFESFLSTGNIPTGFNEFKQTSGFSVIAERLNYMRFLAHFRSIHRGTFFQDLQTTTVRKLRPEGWGFFCPVHTPDGSPCGLLNHLTESCSLTTSTDAILNVEEFCSILSGLGMSLPYSLGYTSEHIPVILDGVLIGFLSENLIDYFETKLRELKADEKVVDIPRALEVAIFRPGSRMWPSINLFSNNFRLLRPVVNLKTKSKEYIGSLEQLTLQIAAVPEDIKNSPNFTHVEISPTMIFSLVGSLTPFCENNQSPRNIYQCQMLKQTMGTPYHSHVYRTDNKVFRIQNPQSPITRNKNHENYQLDNFLTGTNAIVAVLAHTGYDMEDAMIINKSSWERGFGYGYMYKTIYIDLNEEESDSKQPNFKIFSNTFPDQPNVLFEPSLDEDGLPVIGSKIEKGKPYYCYWDPVTSSHKSVIYKGNEETAYVENIVAIGYANKSTFSEKYISENCFLQKVQLQLRVPRVPTIGDKFSSRHGQKGVLSQLWPQIDMPFSESGMCPDLLINPNAFPSRMTIGMLIESMAGKAGALHGISQDSTPFQYSEENTAVDNFGNQLLKAGYNYYGNEVMYSGITGEEFKVDIFLGVVYYQRLRHMVADKYQVRSTGTRTQIHKQPIGGRKRGGGIRFGEMERDSLLAHGASFLLHERLMFSSDFHKAYVCTQCGSLLTPTPLSKNEDFNVNEKADDGRPMFCCYCKTSSKDSLPTTIKHIPLPYVTRFLASELMAMNIRLFFDVKKIAL